MRYLRPPHHLGCGGGPRPGGLLLGPTSPSPPSTTTSCCCPGGGTPRRRPQPAAALPTCFDFGGSIGPEAQQRGGHRGLRDACARSRCTRRPTGHTCGPTAAASSSTDDDVRFVETAIEGARSERPDLDPELLSLLGDLLCGRVQGRLEAAFVTRFQQLTGPVRQGRGGHRVLHRGVVARERGRQRAGGRRRRGRRVARRERRASSAGPAPCSRPRPTTPSGARTCGRGSRPPRSPTTGKRRSPAGRR